MLVLVMDEGFILSNKFRKIVFDGFASGETDINRIIKKYRIIPAAVKRVTDDFINGGILEQKGNKYFLTKEGKKLSEIIRG